MKKILLLSFFLLFISCSGSDETKTQNALINTVKVVVETEDQNSLNLFYSLKDFNRNTINEGNIIFSNVNPAAIEFNNWNRDYIYAQLVILSNTDKLLKGELIINGQKVKERLNDNGVINHGSINLALDMQYQID